MVLYADMALNRSLWPAEGVSLALPTVFQVCSECGAGCRHHEPETGVGKQG